MLSFLCIQRKVSLLIVSLGNVVLPVSSKEGFPSYCVPRECCPSCVFKGRFPFLCLVSKDWGTLLVWCRVSLVSRNILQGRMSVSPVSCVRMLVDTQKECSFSFCLLCLPETVYWRKVTSFNTDRGDSDWRWLSSPLTVRAVSPPIFAIFAGPIVDYCDGPSNLQVSTVDSI